MVKKSLIAGITAIILSLCCGMCFAANDNQKSVNLGNEITKSMDKAGQSMQNVTDNVFSGNVINNTKNGAMNITNDVTNGIKNTNNDMKNENNRINDGIVNDTRGNTGNYNTTRTTAEATTTGFGTMSTTTWMWIILAVAAIIIIAAIWYYATQNNE